MLYEHNPTKNTVYWCNAMINPFFQKKELNKAVPIPLYYQLKELLLSFIHEEEPYTVIPTETELCAHFDISRSTVRQALGELTSEGYLERHKGKGTMILPQKIKQEFLEVLESFNDEMQEKGLTPHTKVITLELVLPPPDVAISLQVPQDGKVVHLKRLRSINKEPIVLVSTYLPTHDYALEGLLHDDLEKESLYSLMRKKYGVQIESSRRVLEIRLANDADAKLLQVAPLNPVQYIETTSFDDKGVPIEFSKARYRGDKNSFVIEIRKKKI